MDECWIVVDIVLLKYEDFFFDRRIYGMIRIDISNRTTTRDHMPRWPRL